MNEKTSGACFPVSFFVPRCGCRLSNRKKRPLGHSSVYFYLTHDVTVQLRAFSRSDRARNVTIRWRRDSPVRPRKGRLFAILRSGPYEEGKKKERKNGGRNRTRRSGGSDHNQNRRNCRDVVRALNEKRVRHPCWGLCLSRRVRCAFSDESSIIGKYDKRAAPPPTKGTGTVKNLAELTLQIRTSLAIGPSE